MKKLTFEIRSPAHQQNAIHAVQQILPDPTKPIVVTIQERNRSFITKMKAYRDAWEEHRNRYQKDIEKLESENTELKRRLGEAKRDIDAYKRLVGGDSHA
ncbi:recombination protein NinB [Salmonella enterica]|uniref:recombination protein NinB n=1 Tax=Salmonella enterica TaxID=28901 RepID=UPI002FFB0C8C